MGGNLEVAASAAGARLAAGTPAARRGRWPWRTVSQADMVIAACTALGLAIRAFTLTRPGFLTGITEYDDGVYLGAAVRLTEGALPYRDFAFIQPPGIVVLMTPVALVAKVTTTVKALALARVLTTCAAVACIALAGSLVRYRGALATLVTCGILAVYPGDIDTSHTLMLEPWLTLACLLAVTLAIRRGQLASPGRLRWAGLALGFAVTVKFWALLPAMALLAVCVARGAAQPGHGRQPGHGHRGGRGRRVRCYLTGLAAGCAVPLAPFVIADPGGFWRSTVTAQAARAGTAVPLAERLAHLTGLIDILDYHGNLLLDGGPGSVFATGSAAPLNGASAMAWLPYLAAATAAALLVGGHARRWRRLDDLEWLSLGSAAASCAAILGYSAFFYHYTDFPAPWLALALSSGGIPANPPRPPFLRRVAVGTSGSRPHSRVLAGAGVAVVIAAVALLQAREVAPLGQPAAQAMAGKIPRGACLVTDEASLAIDADRFTGQPPGCPDIVDSLAQTLVASGGASVQGGASRRPAVVAAWRGWLGRARYVWLSPQDGSWRRIPWTPGLLSWFTATFRPVGRYTWGTGQLYVRVR